MERSEGVINSKSEVNKSAELYLSMISHSAILFLIVIGMHSATFRVIRVRNKDSQLFRIFVIPHFAILLNSLSSQRFYVRSLKRLFIILALAGILLQAFSKGIILLNFEINRDFIAKNLCIKKDDVDNCCKGSCHLKKQLSEDEKKESAGPVQNLKDKSEVQLFQETNQPFIFPAITEQKQFPVLRIDLPFSPEQSIFHPPPTV